MRHTGQEEKDTPNSSYYHGPVNELWTPTLLETSQFLIQSIHIYYLKSKILLRVMLQY
jgi:hypothetical protein